MQVLLRRDVYRALSSVSGFVGNAAAQLQQAAGEDVAELAEVRPGGIRTSSRANAPDCLSRLYGLATTPQKPSAQSYQKRPWQVSVALRSAACGRSYCTLLRNLVTSSAKNLGSLG